MTSSAVRSSIRTYAQPAVFYQDTHDSVINFLKTFSSTNLVEMKAHSTTVRTICTIAATAFACAAAVAHKTAHKGAAIGLGISAVVILVAGIVKGVRATEEFIELSKSFNQAAKHLRNAYLSKAIFMINNSDGAGWDFHFSYMYDYEKQSKISNDSRVKKFTTTQKWWQPEHENLCNAAIDTRLPELETVKDPAVKDLLTNFIKARDVLLYGQTPEPGEEVKNKTYVQYPENKFPIFWPSADIDATPIER